MDPKDELLDNLSGGDRQDEQAVIICLQFPAGKFKKQKALYAVFELDAIFRYVIETSAVGNYDGFEICEGPDEESVKFFIYGQDARQIYAEIKPILESLQNLPEIQVIKRYSHLIEDQFPLNS